MGLFTKHEKTHFVRDEQGNVTKILHNGKEIDRDELKMKSSEQLMEEYYKKHPEKRLGVKLQRFAGKAGGWIDRNLQPVGGYPTKRTSRKPPKRSTQPISSFSLFGEQPLKQQKQSNQKYAIVGGKAYPIAKQKTSKKKKKSKRKSVFQGFDPMDNWGFMK